jgi:hypothetical protein
MKLQTINVLSGIYDEETQQKITELRRERWALLFIVGIGDNTRKANHLFSAKYMCRVEARCKVVNEMLFQLTDNPIYDVK